MPVHAFEATERIGFAGFKIRYAMINLVSMVVYPRTGDIVFALAQRLLVTARAFQSGNEGILIGTGDSTSS